MRREVLRSQGRVFGEGALKGLDGVIKDPARQGVEDQQKPDEDNDIGEHRRLFQRSQNNALHQQTAYKRQGHGSKKRAPVRPARLHQRPGQKGRESGHLALGKINVVRGLMNHHQRQCNRAVNDAVGQA